MRKVLDMSKMVKLREASEMTGFSYYYLRKACNEGLIAHVRAGNKILVNMDWLEDYLNHQGIKDYERMDQIT